MRYCAAMPDQVRYEPNDLSGVSVRAKVWDGDAQEFVIVGQRGGLDGGVYPFEGKLSDGDLYPTIIEGIGGGSAIPGSDHVRTLTPQFIFEFKLGGDVWFPAGSQGGVNLHFTWGDPCVVFRDADGAEEEGLLYDLGISKACSYVDGQDATQTQVCGEINAGIAAEVEYDPGHWPGDHPLRVYDANKGLCWNHAGLMVHLLQSIGIDGTVVGVWGGCDGDHYCEFGYLTRNVTIRFEAAQYEGAAQDPHFTYHAQVDAVGMRYDPSYGTTGAGVATEFSPAHTCSHTPARPGLVAATRREKANALPPLDISKHHAAVWTCPH